MVGDERKPRILLIEDDVFMIDLLVQELKGAGFDTAVAKTGAEAVQKFEEEKPDLILLDVILPDQSGFETLRQIRRKPQGAETKVIVLSNIGENKDQEEARRLGAADYLVKANSSLPEIVEKVRGLL